MKKSISILAVMVFLLSTQVNETYAQGPLKSNASFLFGDVYDSGYNFGIGGRVGTTLSITLPLVNEIYIGVLGMYHRDDSEVREIPTEFGSESVELETQIDYLGFEIGFPILNKGLRIRSSTVIGRAAIRTQEAFSAADNSAILIAEDTDGRFLLSSGVVFSIPLGKYSIGAEARYVDISNFKGFATFGTIGFDF